MRNTNRWSLSKGVPLFIDKKEGETPLEALERLRLERGISHSAPMTYAGRLDPMAEGALIILVGDECKEKERYIGLDKTYEVDVLLGIDSDTGDALGIVEPVSAPYVEEAEAVAETAKLLGKRREKYPRYSSKPVDGKPLFKHMREGGIAEAFIPEKDIQIYHVDILGIYEIGRSELVATATERIGRVRGDFRQKESVDSWRGLLRRCADERQFQLIRLRVDSSSGAYMRTLAQRFGTALGTAAIAWKIRRISIGGVEKA
jgi:tRNA pseudouridine(55) synthase